MESHPFLFPDFARRKKVSPHYGLNQRADEPYTDPWGCVWETSDDGITGSVRGHPLRDLESLPSYAPPDPMRTDGTFPIDWDQITARVRRQKENGEFVGGGLPHGHTFLRLQDIRGYENLTDYFGCEFCNWLCGPSLVGFHLCGTFVSARHSIFTKKGETP